VERKPVRSADPRPGNVISVDVEEYFHAESFASVTPPETWTGCESRVDASTRRLLDLFAAHGVEATFFVLGWVADRYPALVRDIASAGHELACHSYWHRHITRLTPEEFREDTRRAKDAIEQRAGVRVDGYRAPTYSIVPGTLWALDVLCELGFTYDSSIYPIHHDRYGIPGAPRMPFVVRTRFGSLVEYPIATFRLGGRTNLPFGGGGYLRLLPWWYTRLGLHRAAAEGLPVVAYIHPWEIDPGQPRLACSRTTRLRHYTNLKSTYRRLERLVASGQFTSFRRSAMAPPAETIHLESWRAA
jgi:polysaccharide deacetylase family protein (PEP-CTERM system associated)